MTVTIDKQRCIRCGRCTTDCPLRALSAGEDGFPFFSSDGYCVKCGHCEAGCPEKAVELTDSGFSVSAYPNTPIPDQVAFSNLVRSRRSIRSYESRPVPDTTIDALFDVVRFAPTASNGQIVEWTLLGRERIEQLSDRCIEIMAASLQAQDAMSEMLPLGTFLSAHEAGRNPIFYNAPHLAVTHTPSGLPTAMIDSTIALTHLDLALPTFGLGGCWTGLFYLIASHFPVLYKEIGIPDGNVITGGLMFGFSRRKYRRIPKRRTAQLVRV